MSHFDTSEPTALTDDTDDDFDAWSLDELDNFADERSMRALGPHDGDD